MHRLQLNDIESCLLKYKDPCDAATCIVFFVCTLFPCCPSLNMGICASDASEDPVKEAHAKISNQPTHRIKLILAGDSAVGKTSYLRRLHGESASNTIATVGCDFGVFRVVSEDGLDIQVWLWDVAGATKFDSVTRDYFRNANGVIFIFDLTNINSMFSLRDNWMPRIVTETAATTDNLSRQSVPVMPKALEVIVLGNKADLVDDRVIEYDEAAAFVRAAFGEAPYVEISCKTETDMARFTTPRNWLVTLVMNNPHLERLVRLSGTTRTVSSKNVTGASTLGLFIVFLSCSFAFFCAFSCRHPH